MVHSPLFGVHPMKTKSPYIFFLGGRDLEMREIRKLLQAQGYEEGIGFFDKKLRWGVKLSAYREHFLPDKTLVGIELSEDIAPPSNYLSIDHHNERSDEPASIEQVAKLLGVELNQRQRLVAANDKGYIPAMKAQGASQEEIDEIRRADRKAQKVTEEDERLAEIAIKWAFTQGPVTLVKSLSSRFSPITDRMYGKTQRLLVFTEQELTYYGTAEDKALLAEAFEAEVKARKMYHGGQEGGFFGVDSGAFSAKELRQTKNKMLEIIERL
jgi:transposase-like protein